MTTTIFHKAAILGTRIGGQHSGHLMTCMQVTHALAALRRAKFDNSKFGRLRRHVLVIGPPGTGKSSIIDYFFDTIVGSLDTSVIALLPVSSPVIAKMSGSTTFSGLRGSVSGEKKDKTVTTPPFAISNYYYSSEMMEFIRGENVSIEVGITRLLNLLEDGAQNITLNKAVGAKFPEELRNLGIDFNSATGTLRYSAKGAMVLCTVPFSDKESQFIMRSGFKDRFVAMEARPTRDERKELVRRSLQERSFDPEESELREFNRRMWGVEFLNVNRPPAEMITPIVDKYFQFFDSMEETLNASTEEDITLRMTAEIEQLVVAHAVVRSVEALPMGSVVVPSLEYEEADIEFANRYLESVTFPAKETELQNKMRSNMGKDTILAAVMSFMDANAKETETPWFVGSEIRNSSLISWFTTTMRIQRDTAYKYLHHCHMKGYLAKTRYGHSTITAKTNSMYWDSIDSKTVRVVVTEVTPEEPNESVPETSEDMDSLSEWIEAESEGRIHYDGGVARILSKQEAANRDAHYADIETVANDEQQ